MAEHRRPRPWWRRWPALVLFAVLAGGEVLVSLEAIRLARGVTPLLAPPLTIALALAAGTAVLAAICLLPRLQRTRWRPQEGEQPLLRLGHRSLRRLAWNAPFALFLPLSWWLAPGPVWLALAVAVALAVLPIFIWLTTGFHYVLWTQGLEIRLPGWRLAFLPAAEIDTVDVQDIHPLRDWGGWGLRGSGRHRAFIWDGHQAVRICGPWGEVFLGHDDPETLARTITWAYLTS